jgi:hypothetical protein
MRYLKLRYLAIAIGTAGLAYSYSNPAFAVCALADAISSKSGYPHELKLIEEARKRIATTFGQPKAEPKTVFWDTDDALSPLGLNAYGTTQFIGTRACVIIGPKGSNIDVVAHELMHAEIFEHVGFWIRMTELPVWFDEGVAMQVDYRSAYDFPKGEDSSFARQLNQASKFYVADDRLLTRNYAGAKSEVTKWFRRVGAQTLYSTLEHMRNGRAFKSLIN